MARSIKPWDLTAQTFTAWSNDGALQLGAALAYYAVFSISPFLIIILAVAGFFYKGDSFAYIHARIAALAGGGAADTITSAINSVHSAKHSLAATAGSIIVLFIGASGFFVQLQSSMNQIWGCQTKARALLEGLSEGAPAFVWDDIGRRFSADDLGGIERRAVGWRRIFRASASGGELAWRDPGRERWLTLVRN